MKTLFSMQREFAELLKKLVEAEYDIAAAYEAAIKNLSNDNYRTQFNEFLNNHLKYIAKFSKLLAEHSRIPPKEPNEQNPYITKRNVIIDTLVGDEVILEAMRINENDIDVVYERLSNREDLWQDASVVIVRALADIKYHKVWFDNILNDFMLEKTE